MFNNRIQVERQKTNHVLYSDRPKSQFIGHGGKLLVSCCCGFVIVTPEPLWKVWRWRVVSPGKQRQVEAPFLMVPVFAEYVQAEENTAINRYYSTGPYLNNEGFIRETIKRGSK